MATGRLLDPVIRPRGPFANCARISPTGAVRREQLAARPRLRERSAARWTDAIRPAERPFAARCNCPWCDFDSRNGARPLSVRESLRGKHILLIGATGFIGKVWLANLLTDLPEIGRIHLLIRGNRTATALERFQRIVEESPVFEPLAARHGDGFADFLARTRRSGERRRQQAGPGPGARSRASGLPRSLDLIVNSSGLTDFNPDLRDALAMNVHATTHLLDFLRRVRPRRAAASFHLLRRRPPRRPHPRRASAGITRRAASPDFDATKEWQSLEELIRETEARAESPEVTEEIRQQALNKEHAAKNLHGAALENQIRKESRALAAPDADRRRHAARQRTRLAEHLHVHEEPLRIADSRLSRRASRRPPSPWCGRRSWNRRSRSRFSAGTKASTPRRRFPICSGTFFRQLPTNESKCLDLIPVDLVCRGMTLIAAALVARRHERVYQLATSVANPCDMRPLDRADRPGPSQVLPRAEWLAASHRA